MTLKHQPASTLDSAALPPAGLLRRLAAIIYDTLLLLAILLMATGLLLPLTGGEAIEPGNPFFSIYLILICFFFYAWFWTHGGQTLGMRAWKMRIQQRGGAGITWRQAGLRFLAAIVSWLALGLGFLWMLADRERLAWHDRCSGTVLVVIKPPKK